MSERGEQGHEICEFHSAGRQAETENEKQFTVVAKHTGERNETNKTE